MGIDERTETVTNLINDVCVMHGGGKDRKEGSGGRKRRKTRKCADLDAAVIGAAEEAPAVDGQRADRIRVAGQRLQPLQRVQAPHLAEGRLELRFVWLFQQNLCKDCSK